MPEPSTVRPKRTWLVTSAVPVTVYVTVKLVSMTLAMVGGSGVIVGAEPPVVPVSVPVISSWPNESMAWTRTEYGVQLTSPLRVSVLSPEPERVPVATGAVPKSTCLAHSRLLVTLDSSVTVQLARMLDGPRISRMKFSSTGGMMSLGGDGVGVGVGGGGVVGGGGGGGGEAGGIDVVPGATLTACVLLLVAPRSSVTVSSTV